MVLMYPIIIKDFYFNGQKPACIDTIGKKSAKIHRFQRKKSLVTCGKNGSFEACHRRKYRAGGGK